MEITRKRFQEAIEAGLKAARFDASTVNKLREFGRTATEVGTSFTTSTGCPLMQTGLYGSLGFEEWDQTAATEGWAFVTAYDKALEAAITLSGTSFLVVDKEPSLCGFCHGQPVKDASEWLDGNPAYAPCPRCGETNA